MTRADRFYVLLLVLSLCALDYIAMLKRHRVTMLTRLRARVR